MLQVTIPGRDINLHLSSLLLDLNGTLTVDGVLPEGVKERVFLLKEKLNIYILTADTYGTGKKIADELGIELLKVSGEDGGIDKRDFLNNLGKEKTIAIGNGYNDRLMLEEAVLSIVIIGNEGCSIHALKNADIAVKSIVDAMDLLINPLRIAATLRA